VHELEQDLDEFVAATVCDAVLAQLDRAVVGKRGPLKLVLAGILAGGHVLIEDNPGLAETLAARSFAQALGLDFRRVQFTPDLLPSDITGAFVYDPQQLLATRWGRGQVGPVTVTATSAHGLLWTSRTMGLPLRITTIPLREGFTATELMPNATGIVGAHRSVGRVRASMSRASGRLSPVIGCAASTGRCRCAPAICM
jgi:MoxR-like ATPase